MQQRFRILSRFSTLFVAGFFIFSVIFFWQFAPEFVVAQSGDVIQGSDTSQDAFGLNPIGENTKLGKTNLLDIVKNVINVMLGLLGIIAVILFLYAGYLIMTSGGQEDKVAQGKKIMINATIGLVIILSAFAIVQFIFRILMDATGAGGSGGGKGGNVTIDSFSGAGALGKVIKYHYPENNQKGVYRNTAIAITFKVPIDPSTIVENLNNTCWPKNGSNTPVVCTDPSADAQKPYFGDCIPPAKLPAGTYKPEVHCDRLKSTAVQIFRTDTEDLKNNVFVSATAQVNYSSNGLAYTYVFKPLNLLGSETAEVPYEVRLLNGKKDGQTYTGLLEADPNSNAVKPLVFAKTGFYRWVFTTSKELDNAPPTVSFVFPKDHTTTTKDVIIGVLFSEAINPITIEGIVNQSGLPSAPATSQKNVLFGHLATNPLSDGKPFPAGEWMLSNAYKTAEFFPTDPCGINSCGQQKYCLQIVQNDADKNNVAYARNLTIGLLTAEIAPGGLPFESVPLTGITDMAGNALDGNKNAAPDGKPALGEDYLLEPLECGIPDATTKKDNYCWSFVAMNDTDREPPYVQTVTPAIDQESADTLVDQTATILFSRLMTEKSLDDLIIEEYTSKKGTVKNENGEDIKTPEGTGLTYDDLLYDDYVLGKQIKTALDTTLAKERTQAIIDPTADFGRGVGIDLYYFSGSTSTVKDKFQNCLYPGRGPKSGSKGQPTTCTYNATTGAVTGSCIDVSVTDGAKDTGCATTVADGNKSVADIAACKTYLKDQSTQ